MGYYAAYLDVTGRRCLVVGGGAQALAKVEGLLQSDATVVAAAPAFNAGLVALGAAGKVELVERESFDPGDLDGCFVVVDASEDRATGDRVFAEARARKVLVNVLDRPELCDFIAPALVRRGPLQVAISTAGRSPFMASHMRRLLEEIVGDEHGALVELVGELRDRLRAEGLPLPAQQRIYERVISSDALDLLRDGRVAEARAAVQACAEEAP